MPITTEALRCRRCGSPVITSRQHYDTFEGMHFVCFHFEFEHRSVDVDSDCGLRGCPAGELPVAAPSPEAQQLLHDVAEALRAPYSADGPQLEFEQPGVLMVTQSGQRIRLVALDAREQQR